jgi:hypothetical protein
MARMHPDILELEYTESEAEIFVYEELRKQLDETFHVFHSVTWTGSRNIRGECDFVIFSKKHGFVTLEVKGGRIEMVDNTWYSTTRANERFRIKDPIKQARYAQWAFRDLYKACFKEFFSGIFTWAVCFPDSAFVPSFHHKDLNQYNVLHAGNLGHIRKWIEELFHYTRPGERDEVLEKKEAENFLSLFNVSMKLPRSILFTLHKQREELENINQFQDYLLDLFDDKNRVGFQGAAGTGKTWIAIKKAARLAERGKRVLFLCFSNDLERYIREHLAGFRSVRVTTFHSFAVAVLADVIISAAGSAKHDFKRFIRDLFRKVPRPRQDSFDPEEFELDSADIKALVRRIAGLREGAGLGPLVAHYKDEGILDEDLLDIFACLLPSDAGGYGSSGFYSDRLPKALLEVFEDYRLQDQFDAIVIDEAQDFEENWCDCITYFFKSRQDRTIYIFYDDNQSIFRNVGELPVVRLIAHRGLGNFIFHLRNNLRNTQEIHDYAVRTTGMGSTAHSMDIRGLEPEEASFRSSEEVRRYVGKILHDLVTVHGLAGSSITVLCNVPLSDSPFGHFSEIGGFTLVPEGPAVRTNEIVYRTISQFKGLESDIAVVVLDYKAKTAEPHHRITPELLYVGFTRAKYMLYAVKLGE